MATGAIAALVFGKLLDRFGVPILVVAFGVSAFFAPLVFLRGETLALVGMILWGLGLGAQDSCLKAALSAIVPSGRRSTGFGVFDTAFGVAWFAGSAVMGLLYEKSIIALIVFSIAAQLLAVPVLALAKKEAAAT
jgi:MFS family permease